ncbi:hypothetical protein ABPG74_014507 [Tetrahymena malaccensis]
MMKINTRKKFENKYYSSFLIILIQNRFQNTCKSQIEKCENYQNTELQQQQKPQENQENVEEQIQDDKCEVNFVPSMLTKSSRKSIFSSDSQILQTNINYKYSENSNQEDQIIEITQQNFKEQKTLTNQNDILLQEQINYSPKYENIQKLERNQLQGVEAKFSDSILSSPIQKNTLNNNFHPKSFKQEQIKMINKNKQFELKEQNIQPKQKNDLNTSKEQNLKNVESNMISQSIKAVQNNNFSQKIRKIIFGVLEEK